MSLTGLWNGCLCHNSVFSCLMPSLTPELDAQYTVGATINTCTTYYCPELDCQQTLLYQYYCCICTVMSCTPGVTRCCLRMVDAQTPSVLEQLRYNMEYPAGGGDPAPPLEHLPRNVCPHPDCGRRISSPTRAQPQLLRFLKGWVCAPGHHQHDAIRVGSREQTRLQCFARGYCKYYCCTISYPTSSDEMFPYS